MKTRNFLAVLLLMVAGLQTAWAQGFRVYQSDGTQFNFSLKTDSIVFDNGLSGDQVFGPFTPVNQCIVGTWKWGSGTVTFNADGTTDVMDGATYEFMPYQGVVIIYNSSGKPTTTTVVYKVTAEEMYTQSSSNYRTINVWTRVHQEGQPVTGITLSATTLSLQPGQTAQLSATVSPSNASSSVTWESSNTAVAKVSSSGLVTAVANGTATITCRANDGSGVYAECQVTVTAGTPVTSITLNETAIELNVGDTQTLTATVLPENASNKTLAWSSNDTSVASVNDSGKVTAHTKGSCTITCRATDGSGVKATCAVTVVKDGIDGTVDGHDYVVIGGIGWATANIGATTVAGSYTTCCGDYFVWSETTPRYVTMNRTGANEATFTWKDGYSDGYNIFPTYDGTSLDEAHDAAKANWGSNWRTPTTEEYQALMTACTGSSSNRQTPVVLTSAITSGGIYWLSETQTIEPAYTGVAGVLFVSASNIKKRVFFPASGFIDRTSIERCGRNGRSWATARYTASTAPSAYHLFYDSEEVKSSDYHLASYGMTLRPVLKQ